MKKENKNIYHEKDVDNRDNGDNHEKQRDLSVLFHSFQTLTARLNNHCHIRTFWQDSKMTTKLLSHNHEDLHE